VLVYVLYDKRDEFAQSLKSASIWVLLLASLLQLVAQLFRTEAWHLSVEAAGATCGRRRLFQAAGIGSLASQLNAQLGTAARIGILRRWDGPGSPRVPALIAAEVPIMAVEGGLAAIACFTLVGPLNLPFWSPIPVLVLGSNGVAVVAAAGVLLTATGTFGGLVFLLWGVLDRGLRRGRPAETETPPTADPEPDGEPVTARA
jgi:hypothetical protein